MNVGEDEVVTEHAHEGDEAVGVEDLLFHLPPILAVGLRRVRSSSDSE